jgi:hypothetical protein
MDIYRVSVIIHVTLTMVAFLTGIIAMIAQPKGSKLHRKSGILYFISFLSACALALFMLFLKYRALLLGITFFNIYLCVMGYKAVRYKEGSAALSDLLLMGLLAFGIIILFKDGIRVYNGWLGTDFGWVVVRFFYILLIGYILFSDMRYFLKKNKSKAGWLTRHMEMMLISFIALISGILQRTVGAMDYFSTGEIKWIFWIGGYVLCLPLVFYWISKYKPRISK